MLVGYASAVRDTRSALRLCDLRHYGWQTTVYTPDIPILDAPFRRQGIDMRHLPMRGLTDYATIRELASHLEHEARGACIVTQSFRTSFIAMCARKLAMRPDLQVTRIYHRIRPPRTTWLAKRVYRNLSALIFTSARAQEIFHATEHRLGRTLTPPSRLHVVTEGVGRQPAPAPEPSGPILALYNGELRPECGLLELIDSLSDLRGKRIRLLIAGHGRSDFMDRLRRHAIRRDVMDMISWRRERTPLSDLASQCHFGIAPYISEDLFSDSNIEIMAAGRPQILTHSPIATEYIGTDGGAVYTAPGDTAAILASMLRLAADAPLRATLSAEAAGRYGRLFTPDITLKALADVLANLAAPDSQRRF